jgi:hypothetical protein
MSNSYSLDDSVESLAGMKAQLPRLRKRLNQDPEYFKKVYGHAFVMSLQPGARVLALDSGEFAKKQLQWRRGSQTRG